MCYLSPRDDVSNLAINIFIESDDGQEPKAAALLRGVRKLRRNQRLSRHLCPRSAVEILNVIRPGIKFEFEFDCNGQHATSYVVYEGKVVGKIIITYIVLQYI